MKRKLMIVDDSDINRELLKDILSTDYEILEAADGIEALDIINQYKQKLSGVLLDLLMPRMNGYQVLEELECQKLTSKIPVLIISSEQSIVSERKCFEYGIADFIKRPYNEQLIKLRVGNAVKLFSLNRDLERRVEEQNYELQEQFKVMCRQAEKLRGSNEKIIDILGTVVETRNLESGRHIQRVKEFTEILALEMLEKYPDCGLDRKQINIIVAASPLHDIGKIAINDSILLKPCRLSDEEFAAMRQHTVKGCALLNSIEGIWDEDYAKACYDICRYHHERNDGNGYPDGLKGDEIPISAQLVALADVYDALTSERCYKMAYSTEKAYEMILSGECGEFSPRIIDCFISSRDSFEQCVLND